jgi:hypothetical protein
MTNEQRTLLRAIFQADQKNGAQAGEGLAAIVEEQRTKFWTAYSITEVDEVLRSIGFPLVRSELIRIVKRSGGVRRKGRWYLRRDDLARLIGTH